MPKTDEIFTLEQKKYFVEKNINYCRYAIDCDKRYEDYCKNLNKKIGEINGK